VQEIYALDEDSLRALGYSFRSFSAKFTAKGANPNCSPAHGMIFLFRWKPEPMDSTEDTCPEHVWFANQVIDNACASLALLNIVFNCDADIGPQLKSFKEFSAQLNPPMRGLAVANNKHIRNIHNSFARKMEMVDVDINLAEIACKKPRALGSSSDDVDPGIEVFHFIAYVHVDNALYELDGLKKQPVKLCTCPKEDWLVHAGPAVQERIASYGDEELLFNLLAIVPQSSPPDESFAEIARRRKVDYEAFAHKTATILARAGIAKKLCS